MLKVACLPSHPLEKLVARKKRRGSEARLVATLIQKVTDGSRLSPVSATVIVTPITSSINLFLLFQ